MIRSNLESPQSGWGQTTASAFEVAVRTSPSCVSPARILWSTWTSSTRCLKCRAQVGCWRSVDAIEPALSSVKVRSQAAMMYRSKP